MPDARIRYRDAMVGAIFTSIMFFLGRIALAYYLSFTNPGAQLGAAAAALVVISHMGVLQFRDTASGGGIY